MAPRGQKPRHALLASGNANKTYRRPLAGIYLADLIYTNNLLPMTMKQILLLLTISSLLFACNQGQGGKSKKPVEIRSQIQSISSLDNWTTLEKYIGTFAKSTDFLKNPIIDSELKRILGSDYNAYLDHVAQSGSGQIVEEDKILISDISQLHVGGYNSQILLDIKAQKGYLFWLSSSVSEKKFKIYGDKPIPNKVLTLIVNNLNVSWGHVANFKIVDGNIHIDLK